MSGSTENFFEATGITLDYPSANILF